MENTEIRSLEAVDSDEASNLLKLVMGNAFGRQKSATFWAWKHRANPAGQSLGYAAYSPSGELIALRPFMRWRLLDDTGAQVQAVRAVDTAVHPAWRKGGLFSRLTNMALEGLEDEGVALVFNTPNDNSGPGYRKMGWQLLGHPTVWLRPRLGQALFSTSAAQSASALKDLEPFGAHSEQLATYSALSAPRGGLTVLKDAKFLEWRYALHPNLSYAVVVVPRAIAIVREDERAGRRGVALVDYFMESGSTRTIGTLLDAVRKRTQGAYLISGPLPPGQYRRAAVSRGYFPLPWRNVNFAARPITWPSAAAVFKSRKPWHLTLGDLETF